MPSLDKIIDIADYFKVSIDEVVGRGVKFNDKFLETLYEKTNNKEIKWTLNSLGKDHNKIILHNEVYDNDKYAEISYLTKINNSIFLINCFSEHYQTINPLELYFYIQPDEKSDFVIQNYSTGQLKALWICILNNLGEETPDEIKAENIKLQFMNNGTDIIETKRDTALYYKRLKEYYDKINTPEFQDFYKVVTSPKYTKLISDFQQLSKLAKSEDK